MQQEPPMVSQKPDIQAIFNEAILLASDEQRGRYLDEVCRDNPSVRSRVDALLHAHSQAGGFLGGQFATPEATVIRSPIGEGPGTAIGPYKLLQQIGEGGMGIVYMAQQERPVQRTVALKIIKPGMDCSQVIARIEAERQALALMDHPNIARFLDAGTTENGRPYFVMEVVKGIPIVQYADEHRLTPRQRLELVIPVCQAVQHAHQKGIIHRDLKPTNVLVADYDDRRVPKVIDFGVAKAIGQHLTEKTMFTQFGQVVGTIEYMSPEQAKLNQLDIDTRTDIYSLGVLLYELLTGETPFDRQRLRSAAFDEMLRIIREEEPPRPSIRLSSSQSLPSIAANRHCEPAKLSRQLRGELDWIVMKALEKDRGRRYDTANGLAMDIERFLNDEPVTARPASSAYRLRKLVRRNRLAFAMTSAVAAAILMGAVVSTWQAIRATNSEHEQIRLREDADKQRTLATAAAERERNAAEHERNAAEQERQAKEAAVKAERQATLRLADNYASRGIEDDSPLNAQAALWLANAAVTARDDPDRVQANLIRVNNWLRGQWTPVAAVEEDSANSDHLKFEPENSRYLMTFRRYGTGDSPPLIWDLVTEQQLPVPADIGPLGDAAWASGGNILLGTQAGQVLLASMPQLKVLKHWDAGGAVRRVAASADGQIVAAATETKLLVWRVSGQAEPSIVEHEKKIGHIAFSPSGQQLVTATENDGMARLFAVDLDGAASPQLRRVLGPVPHEYRGPKGAATDFFTRPPVFVDGGKQLVTIPNLGESGEVKWYDTQSGAELSSTKLALRGQTDVAASNDGRILFLGMNPGVSFDTQTHEQGTSPGNVITLGFSPDGKFFAYSAGSTGVRKTQQGTIEDARVFPNICQGGQPAFSNDGRYIATLNYRRGLMQVWRLPVDDSLTRKAPFDGRSSWAGFSPDGKYVAPIGNAQGSSSVRRIQVRLAASGEPVGEPLELNADLVAADFSPDSRSIAVVTGIHGDQAQLRIWNRQTGSLVCDPVRFDSEPVWTCFAPDGKAVAVHCMNGEAFLIDPASGGRLAHWTSQPRQNQGTYPWASGRGTIAFSHDGKTVFTWGSQLVQAWDRATGDQRWAAGHNQRCWSLAESPDGRIIATGSYDRYLRFWDAATGNEARPPIEHPGQVHRVAFSPDGRLVGTTCDDWQTRLWEFATGRLVCAISSYNVADVRFTPDSRFAITASPTGLQVWDPHAGSPVSPLCNTATGIPSLDISSDGHWAVVAGDADHYSVVTLESSPSLSKVRRKKPFSGVSCLPTRASRDRPSSI